MYLLIFFFLFIATITPLFGKFIGSKMSINFSIFSIFLSFLISFFAIYEVVLRKFTCELILFYWFNILSINTPFSLYFDKLSCLMLFIVIFVSFFVHIYATNYMESDPGKLRFFFFLSLFTFFMCLMVVSETLLQFFFAWEGVGLSSYLLINFWNTRIEANRSAMKAIIINRFGDFGLYFAILLIFCFYKSLSFTTINTISFLNINYINFLNYSFSINELIAFFFFIAVIGKSAQLGLHTWLPDAMEGPTPVSALLHAATMVTAGVYLLLRISNFLLSAPNIMLLIAFWGALTAFFASSVGAFQNDIKKIIAYSTCSQLGYMVASCGLYNFGGSFFHLFNHAFFKAILFLGAGSVIHALLDEQDLRKYGFLINFLPFTYITMFVGSCSLIGFPFLSGFYSKDVLINWSFSDFSIISSFVYWLLTLSVFFTSFYSTKLLNLTFFSRNPRFSFSLLTSINESDFRFKTPLFFLAFFSIFSGFIFFDLFIGYGNDVLNIAISTENNNYFDLEYLNQFRKFVPLFFVFFGILTYFFSFHSFHKSFFCFFSYRDNEYFKSLIYLKNFFSKKWFFDFFYYKITIFFLNVGYILFKSFDKGIFEDIFVKKSIWFTYNFYKNLILKQNFTSNINTFLIKVLIILLFFLLSFFFFNSIFFIFFIFFIIYLVSRNKKWEI